MVNPFFLFSFWRFPFYRSVLAGLFLFFLLYYIYVIFDSLAAAPLVRRLGILSTLCVVSFYIHTSLSASVSPTGTLSIRLANCSLDSLSRTRFALDKSPSAIAIRIACPFVSVIAATSLISDAAISRCPSPCRLAAAHHIDSPLLLTLSFFFFFFCPYSLPSLLSARSVLFSFSERGDSALQIPSVCLALSAKVCQELITLPKSAFTLFGNLLCDHFFLLTSLSLSTFGVVCQSEEPESVQEVLSRSRSTHIPTRSTHPCLAAGFRQFKKFGKFQQTQKRMEWLRILYKYV